MSRSGTKLSVHKPTCDYPGEAKKRRCLMCSNEFASGGPGERVCRSCKNTVAWRDDAGVGAFSAYGHRVGRKEAAE